MCQARRGLGRLEVPEVWSERARAHHAATPGSRRHRALRRRWRQRAPGVSRGGGWVRQVLVHWRVVGTGMASGQGMMLQVRRRLRVRVLLDLGGRQAERRGRVAAHEGGRRQRWRGRRHVAGPPGWRPRPTRWPARGWVHWPHHLRQWSCCAVRRHRGGTHGQGLAAKPAAVEGGRHVLEAASTAAPGTHGLAVGDHA